MQNKIPLLRGGDRKPLWLKTPQLLAQASHCEAPRFPLLLVQASTIEAKVTVSILVDEKGEVCCVQAATGHPLMFGSAIDAARKWRFKPMTQDGKLVGFYGVLEFHFSTANAGTKGDSCLEARW
jgi:TonB family protein